jgi:serine/threonine protein kinase
MRLSFHTSDGSFRAADLTRVKTSVVVGRDRAMAQLVIPDIQASRAHCQVLREEDGSFSVEDMGSRNGTWVNGIRIDRRVKLKQGDILRIGGTDLKVGGSMLTTNDDSGLLGQNLGGFELQEVLGRGSYGTVFRGNQTALSRPVAIKVLDKRHQAKPETVRGFIEEAQRAGRLNHPNVVQVHDVRQVDDHYLLVMELMTGGSMADRLRVDGPLDNEAMANMLADIGHALAYAESQRLVHRDVKPDNILVNAEGIHKLADLGIAMPISSDGQAHQVRTFGSAHYVAPEQAKGGAIDGRADIYALGASAWHLAVGRPMYEGTARQIVASHINDETPDLRKEKTSLSESMLRLIMSMLAKDPDERPETGEEIAEAVNDIRNGRAYRTPSGEFNGPKPLRRRVRRRRR